MKTMHRLLVGLLLLALVLNTYALDDYLYQIGWGSEVQDASFNHVRMGWNYNMDYGKWNWVGDKIDKIYYLFPYAGTIDLTVYVDALTVQNNASTFQCYALNLSGNTQTWTHFLTEALDTSDNLTINEACSGTANTNTGVIYCYFNDTSNIHLTAANISFYGEATYTNKEYHTYNAGEQGILYSVNRWNNNSLFIADGVGRRQVTYVSNYDIDRGVEMTIGNDTYTDGTTDGMGFSLNTFTPHCLNSGLTTYVWRNYNLSNPSDVQVYYQTLNITPIEEINITSFTYAQGENLTFPNQVQLNLSVSTNAPLLVDFIAWRTDGELSYVSATQYNWSPTLAVRNEPYNISVQLGDIECDTPVPERTFSVSVGQYINLTGIIYGRYTATEVYPLQDAYVQLNDSDDIYGTTTNSLGEYSYPLFTPGKYTLTAAKDWFTTVAQTITFSVAGENYETKYGWDLVLNATNNTGGFFITLNCSSSPTSLDIVCSSVNNLNIWYATMDVIFSSAVEGEISLAIPTGGGTFSYYEQWGIRPNCSTPYTIWVDGYEDWTTNTVLTKSCAAVTTTTTTTTTSTTTTIYSPLSLSCVNDATSIDIYCCIYSNVSDVWFNYKYNSTTSGTYINKTGNYTYCFYMNDTTYGDVFCQTTYEVWVFPYYSETFDEITTNNCNGSVTTTTTTTSTTTTILGCYVDQYDLNKNCYISDAELTNALNDYIADDISLSCYTSILYYNQYSSVLPGCVVSVVPPVTYVPPTYTTPIGDCSNLSGKIKTGDLFHASTCAFIMPLGVAWFYGLTTLFVIVVIYMATRTLVASGLIGLLYTSLYYIYLPKPTLTILALGVSFALATMLLGLLVEPMRKHWRE